MKKIKCFVFIIMISIILGTAIPATTFAMSNEIEEYIQVREAATASVSLAVFDANETIYQTNYGYADVENKVKVDQDTVYEWGSVSKMLIWVSVMQLYEQGQIDLEEDITVYLPEGFLTKLAYDETITMTHLMNHTAGFQELVYSDSVERKDASLFVSLEHSLRENEPPQIYKPGEVCSYSNWGAALAAYIVECISGQSFDEYVKEHIFSVLDMNQTALLPDWSDNPWVQAQREKLKCYAIYEDSFESYGQNISHVFLYPIGAAAGTSADLLKFAKAFLPKDGEQCALFQKEETLALFLSPTAYYSGTDIARNYHGLWSLPYGSGVIGHSGNTIGCTSGVYFDLKTQTGIVIMTNEVGETTYNFGLLSVVFGDYQTDMADTFTPSADLSGIHTVSRTAYKAGFNKIFTYMGLTFPISQTADPTVYKVGTGQGDLTQIADHTFLFDNGNGSKSLMVETTSDGGEHKFETAYHDVFLRPTGTYILKILPFLLFLVAVLYAFIMICINIVAVIIKIIRRKPIDISWQNRRRIVTYLAMFGIGVFVYLLLFTEGDILYIQTAVKCIMIVVLSIVSYVCTLRWPRQKELRQSKRISHMITKVMTYIILGNVIYWQWFNFFGY